MNFKQIMTGFIALLCLSTAVLAQIQAGRAINITISNVPSEEKSRIDSMYPISESGFINMPFIGQVRASGLKSEQLASILEARYKEARIYTNPTFQVFISDVQGIEQQVVYIGGQVGRTGTVKWIKGLTLYQAIQAAGGYGTFGSKRRVELHRAGNYKTYDLSRTENMNIQLDANDTIVVPEKSIIGQ